MRVTIRPVVVVSQCLELAAVRYDGQTIRAPIVKRLARHAELRPVCPEIAIGLGVPRDPIRIATVEGRRRLVQPSTGRDLTDVMERFAAEWLDALEDVDGFILKSRSPSCGIRDTKLFDAPDAADPVAFDTGVFGRAVLQLYPHAAVEDEQRLTDRAALHAYLTQLFTNAARRQNAPAPTPPYPPELLD